MLLSDRPRTPYEKPIAHEVICQLRFPTILSINSTDPAEFQEQIRGAFPQYARQQETPPPTITSGGPEPQIVQQQPVSNYHFLSKDGRWKLNLTQNFFALSTLQYAGWEDFAAHLDQPLAEFIRIYHPAYFQRVGLRYRNLISREKMGLEDIPWTELIAPAYLGPMQEADIWENQVSSCTQDFSLQLGSSCQAKVHAGLVRLSNRPNNVQNDPEIKFILDLDLAMYGNLNCNLAPGALETLHGHATPLFEGAITDRLRSAMEPN